MSWFAKERQRWILETIEIYGFMNREHIQKKFGISQPQAAADFAAVLKKHPGRIVYNKVSKRYEVI